MTTPQQSLNRDELLDLYKHYDGAIKNELDLCHQYLNFYVGLLSTVLALTITGLLQLDPKDVRGLIFLIGPALTLALSSIGKANFRAFYRRFTEAWVTKLNIEAMLNYRSLTMHEPFLTQPPYASKYGGFIVQAEWPPIRLKLDQAEKEKWSAERVATELASVGTTGASGQRTFRAFDVVAIVLIVVVFLYVFLP